MPLPTAAELAENIVSAMEGQGVVFDAAQRPASLVSMEGLAEAILDLFEDLDEFDDLADLLGRVLTAGAGLTGGGDLSADRTFNVAAADSSIIVTANAIAAAVKSVHGRTGNVVAASGDYDASQVDYDNAGSSLSATDVEAALDELDDEKVPESRTITAGAGLTGGGDLSTNRTVNVVAADSSIVVAADSIAAAVKSVHGRTGNIVAADSDYDADQVDYDNASSGLAAADVQEAIDELAAGAGCGFVLPASLVTTDTETVLAYFVWDPSWEATVVRFVGQYTQIGGETGVLRIRDIQNSNAIIAQVNVSTGGSPEIETDSSLNNLPASHHVCALTGQLSSDVGNNMSVYGWHIN